MWGNCFDWIIVVAERFVHAVTLNPIYFSISFSRFATLTVSTRLRFKMDNSGILWFLVYLWETQISAPLASIEASFTSSLGLSGLQRSLGTATKPPGPRIHCILLLRLIRPLLTKLGHQSGTNSFRWVWPETNNCITSIADWGFLFFTIAWLTWVLN